jgi:hypothetical protein
VTPVVSESEASRERPSLRSMAWLLTTEPSRPNPLGRRRRPRLQASDTPARTRATLPLGNARLVGRTSHRWSATRWRWKRQQRANGLARRATANLPPAMLVRPLPPLPSFRPKVGRSRHPRKPVRSTKTMTPRRAATAPRVRPAGPGVAAVGDRPTVHRERARLDTSPWKLPRARPSATARARAHRERRT